MTTYRTIQDRVILDPVFAANLSEAGIYLGDGEMTHAVVLAKGPKALDVEIGDKVMVIEGAGQQSQIRRQRVLIIRESDILGIIAE
jgi:co-chaperonin GroES (HSP10)